MRKVSYRNSWEDEGEEKEALFHQFGVFYTACENGVGNFSSAIIEFPDGSLRNVSVNHVRFLEPTDPNDQKSG